MDKNYKIVTANDCHQSVFLEMPILQLIDYHLLQPYYWLRLVCVCNTVWFVFFLLETCTLS